MNILLAAHAVCAVAACVRCTNAASVLLFPREHFGSKAIPNNQERREYNDAVVRAWSTILSSFVLYIGVIGYCTVYYDARNMLLSQLESALLQPVPYSCTTPADRHVPTLIQSLRSQFTPDAEEKLCATYIERTHMSTWPNPVYVLNELVFTSTLNGLISIADAVGMSMASFLSHFSLSTQILLSAAAAALFWAWPMLTATRSLGASLIPRHRPRALLQEDLHEL
jgi:hypothetical protein